MAEQQNHLRAALDGIEDNASTASSTEDLFAARALLLREVQAGGVTHPEVLRALRKVPRHLLVPPHLVHASYQDRPLPIGSEQTISQPTIVGLMSQWAIEGVRPSQKQRALEIGTGSGYQAAILAELFQEVFTMEVRPDLAERAKDALSRIGPPAQMIHCVAGDGTFGLADSAPYDAILVTAAAERVPPALIEQLKPEGRLIIPLVADDEHQLLHLFRRVEGRADQKLETVRTCPVLFVPLVDAVAPIR